MRGTEKAPESAVSPCELPPSVSSGCASPLAQVFVKRYFRKEAKADTARRARADARETSEGREAPTWQFGRRPLRNAFYLPLVATLFKTVCIFIALLPPRVRARDR